jgi:ribosomal protein S14
MTVDVVVRNMKVQRPESRCFGKNNVPCVVCGRKDDMIRCMY